MFKIDLHTHTIASGHAFGTVQENAREAKNKGIELLGITDHGSAMGGAAYEFYFRCGNRLPKNIEGVRILFGVEANVIDDAGQLDLSDNILKNLDFVIVGIHYDCGYIDQGVEKNTETLIKAMQNPYVKIVSHPYWSMMPVDIEAIAKEAVKKNILLEINASFFYTNKLEDEVMWGKMKKMIKILKESGQKMILNSDAHSPYEVGRFQEVVDKFGELGIDEGDLLNDDVEGVLKFLGKE